MLILKVNCIFTCMRFLTIFLLCLVFATVQSQTDAYEAKKLLEIKNASNQKEVCLAYINLSTHYATNNRVKGIEYGQKAVVLAKELKDAELLGTAYERIADNYWYAFNNQQAVKFYLLEKRVADSVNNTEFKARSLYNIGWIKCIQQKETSQVHYLYEAFGIFKQLKDTAYILNSLDALGSFYKDSNDGQRYNDSVIKYYTGALQLIEISRYKKNESISNNNIGEFYKSIKDYKTALVFFNKALKAAEKQKDTFSILISKRSKAEALYLLDSLDKALRILEEIRPYVTNDEQQLENKKNMYGLFYAIYKEKKNYNMALLYHEKFKEINDTLNENLFNSNLKAQENNYQNELNERTINELKHLNELSDLKNRNNKIVIYALTGIVLLVGVILALLFRTYRQNIRSKKLLETQNLIISKKKEEIEQSIEYAKGIQTGILPEVSCLNSVFKENFIFYLPKDIVSGDFYWYQKINTECYIAAADCTGHGVPGALMSVVSIDKLNQAVFEQKLSEPSDILAAINKSIKTALKQTNDSDGHKDGLDIALLKYHPDTKLLHYAGANRPLLLIRNNQLEEFKPTKMAIAGHATDDQMYQQTTIQLCKDDLLFIYSDGYADQFGGPEGKKLMSKALKNIILTNSHSDMKTIEREIKRYFNEWKSHYEQVDDVLIIGLKV